MSLNLCPAQRLIVRTIQTYEGLPLTMADFEEETGLSRWSVWRHSKGLIKDGIIVRRGLGGCGGYRYYYPTGDPDGDAT